MATVLKPDPKSLFADKRALIKILDRLNKEMGFVPVADASIESVRALMLEQGVRPEDNIGSRGVIAARDEE